ncbi:MAG TPA: VWA domain-containing protein [Vicinamibacterales bacterium]|nr:VWA domain-containing protein [Vicinamibacterales bacterium]
MKHMLRPWIGLTAAAAAVFIATGADVAGQKQDDEFRFRSGVDLVNVTATVTDRNGRFVPGLRQDDFIVYEENERQEVTHFSNERVPVSLGLVLDTSGSMVGEKISSALAAVDRFLTKLLSPDDEIFLYTFSSYPSLLQDWTTDRQRLSRAIRRVNASGGTAMLDAIAESVPLAQTGQHRKRAVVLISDGNDTDSQSSLTEVKQMIRESEVMVYAIGIDGQGDTTFGAPTSRPPTTFPPYPSPFPGGRRPRGPGGVVLPQLPQFQWPFPQPPQGRTTVRRGSDERVNAHALREITDDSGGRTEIVRTGRDLDPATANIADELSRQYYLGYSSTTQKDGRWHSIRVETRDKSLKVRARRGYIATP